jgi:hypothetical protein
VRFVLYTDKSIPQSTSALNERLHQPKTRSTPALDGWVEKNGRFSLALTTPVVAQFTRTTRLHGQLRRENGQTIIQGDVPDGAGPQGQIAVLIGIALVAVFVLLQQQAVLAILLALAGGALYIPMRGDYDNSDRLLLEVERALKASPKPPKTTTKAAAVATAARSKVTTAVKPKTAASSAVAARAKAATAKSSSAKPKSTSAKPAAAKSPASKSSASKTPARATASAARR